MSKIFPERLKMARNGLTQQAVADRVGIRQQAYARYESGKITPSIDVLYRLCEVLVVSADWLLGLSDNTGGNVVIASNKGVAVNGNANVVHGNCQECPLMKAAAQVTKRSK